MPCTWKLLYRLVCAVPAGAGDQGLMFGYATDETEECMPLTVVLAHKLNAKMSELRRNGGLVWARPDSKTQVSTCSANASLLPEFVTVARKLSRISSSHTYLLVSSSFEDLKM